MPVSPLIDTPEVAFSTLALPSILVDAAVVPLYLFHSAESVFLSSCAITSSRHFVCYRLIVAIQMCTQLYGSRI